MSKAMKKARNKLLWLATVGLVVGLGMAARSIFVLDINQALAAQQKEGQELQCKLIPQIQQLYLKRHVVYDKLNAKLDERVVDQFIKRLDGAKIYLTQTDVDDIKKILSKHFDKVAKNDCRLFSDAYKIFLSRAEERAALAKQKLESDKWKLDPKTEIQLDPELRKYPKSKAEAEKFQDKYLQFQVSNYIATGTKLDEAKKNVMKSYERSLKQLKEKATNTDELMSDYLDAYARALDPHSTYFTREGKEEFEIDMKLSLEGIGASLSWQDGFTVVEQLIDGGSAKKDGRIQAQDKIVAVGQFTPGTKIETPPAASEDDVKLEMENVIEMPLKDVVRRIRGPKGTKVRLQIMRPKPGGTTESFFVTLTREQVKLEEKAAAIHYLERNVAGQKKKVAVLNLPSFYADSEQGGRSSATDVKNLVKDAKEKGADSMVLDFSTNGGGSLEDAVRIAGLFFRTGAVVRQSSRDGDDSDQLEDRDPAVDWEGPLVVLTSRISASASEIVAGTLKDYKRAVIVGGDHTFGKGTVQQVFPLGRIGLIKVTVGMFFTPGGFSTQHRGVDADVVLPGAWSNDEFGEKSLDYSLQPKKIKTFTSDHAWVASGPGAWKKVETPLISTLKMRSKSRVEKNAEFKKIQVELAKSKKTGKIVKLSESLKDVKEKKSEQDQKKNLTKDEKDQEYLKRADVQEAVNVALDLWAQQTGMGLKEVDKAIRLAEASMKPVTKPAEKMAAAQPDKVSGDDKKSNAVQEGTN